MKSIIVLFMVLFCSTASAAELLVMAQDSCADKLCNRKGDVVSIRPDGFDWEKGGKGYSKSMWKLVKLPGVKEEDARKYLEPLTEVKTEVVDGKNIETGVQIRDRKYRLDPTVLTAMETAKTQVLSVATKDVATYVAKITEKSLTAEKLAIEAADEEIISK